MRSPKLFSLQLSTLDIGPKIGNETSTYRIFFFFINFQFTQFPGLAQNNSHK